MTLLPGGRSTGKVYFDAVGEAPTSVVYNNAGSTLTWTEAPVTPAEPAAEEEAPAEEAPAGGEEAPAGGESADSGAAETEANGDVAAAEEEG
jgi:uncharacterized protein DUF1942